MSAILSDVRRVLRSALLVGAGAALGAGVVLALDDDRAAPYDPTPGDVLALEQSVIAHARDRVTTGDLRGPIDGATCERYSGPGEERDTGRRRYRCLAITYPQGRRSGPVFFAAPYSGLISLDDGRRTIRPVTPQHGM